MSKNNSITVFTSDWFLKKLAQYLDDIEDLGAFSQVSKQINNVWIPIRNKFAIATNKEFLEIAFQGRAYRLLLYLYENNLDTEFEDFMMVNAARRKYGQIEEFIPICTAFSQWKLLEFIFQDKRMQSTFDQKQIEFVFESSFMANQLKLCGLAASQAKQPLQLTLILHFKTEALSFLLNLPKNQFNRQSIQTPDSSEQIEMLLKAGDYEVNIIRASKAAIKDENIDLLIQIFKTNAFKIFTNWNYFHDVPIEKLDKKSLENLLKNTSACFLLCWAISRFDQNSLEFFLSHQDVKPSEFSEKELGQIIESLVFAIANQKYQILINVLNYARKKFVDISQMDFRVTRMHFNCISAYFEESKLTRERADKLIRKMLDSNAIVTKDCLKAFVQNMNVDLAIDENSFLISLPITYHDNNLDDAIDLLMECPSIDPSAKNNEFLRTLAKTGSLTIRILTFLMNDKRVDLGVDDNLLLRTVPFTSNPVFIAKMILKSATSIPDPTDACDHLLSKLSETKLSGGNLLWLAILESQKFTPTDSVISISQNMLNVDNCGFSGALSLALLTHEPKISFEKFPLMWKKMLQSSHSLKILKLVLENQPQEKRKEILQFVAKLQIDDSPNDFVEIVQFLIQQPDFESTQFATAWVECALDSSSPLPIFQLVLTDPKISKSEEIQNITIHAINDSILDDQGILVLVKLLCDVSKFNKFDGLKGALIHPHCYLNFAAVLLIWEKTTLSEEDKETLIHSLSQRYSERDNHSQFLNAILNDPRFASKINTSLKQVMLTYLILDVELMKIFIAHPTVKVDGDFLKGLWSTELKKPKKLKRSKRRHLHSSSSDSTDTDQNDRELDFDSEGYLMPSRTVENRLPMRFKIERNMLREKGDPELECKLEITEFLLEKNIELDVSENEQEILKKACHANFLSLVKLLITKVESANPSVEDHHLLFFAIQTSNLELFRLLFQSPKVQKSLIAQDIRALFKKVIEFNLPDLISDLMTHPSTNTPEFQIDDLLPLLKKWRNRILEKSLLEHSEKIKQMNENNNTNNNNNNNSKLNSTPNKQTRGKITNTPSPKTQTRTSTNTTPTSTSKKRKTTNTNTIENNNNDEIVWVGQREFIYEWFLIELSKHLIPKSVGRLSRVSKAVNKVWLPIRLKYVYTNSRLFVQIMARDKLDIMLQLYENNLESKIRHLPFVWLSDAAMKKEDLKLLTYVVRDSRIDGHTQHKILLWCFETRFHQREEIAKMILACAKFDPLESNFLALRKCMYARRFDLAETMLQFPTFRKNMPSDSIVKYLYDRVSYVDPSSKMNLMFLKNSDFMKNLKDSKQLFFDSIGSMVARTNGNSNVANSEELKEVREFFYKMLKDFSTQINPLGKRNVVVESIISYADLDLFDLYQEQDLLTTIPRSTFAMWLSSDRWMERLNRIKLMRKIFDTNLVLWDDPTLLVYLAHTPKFEPRRELLKDIIRKKLEPNSFRKFEIIWSELCNSENLDLELAQMLILESSMMNFNYESFLSCLDHLTEEEIFQLIKQIIEKNRAEHISVLLQDSVVERLMNFGDLRVFELLASKCKQDNHKFSFEFALDKCIVNKTDRKTFDFFLSNFELNFKIEEIAGEFSSISFHKLDLSKLKKLIGLVDVEKNWAFLFSHLVKRESMSSDILKLLLEELNPNFDLSQNNNYMFRESIDKQHLLFIELFLSDSRMRPSEIELHKLFRSVLLGDFENVSKHTHSLLHLISQHKRFRDDMFDHELLRLVCANSHFLGLDVLLENAKKKMSSRFVNEVLEVVEETRGAVRMRLLAAILKCSDSRTRQNELFEWAIQNSESEFLKSLMLTEKEIDIYANESELLKNVVRKGNLELLKSVLTSNDQILTNTKNNKRKRQQEEKEKEQEEEEEENGDEMSNPKAKKIPKKSNLKQQKQVEKQQSTTNGKKRKRQNEEEENDDEEEEKGLQSTKKAKRQTPTKTQTKTITPKKEIEKETKENQKLSKTTFSKKIQIKNELIELAKEHKHKDIVEFLNVVFLSEMK